LKKLDLANHLPFVLDKTNLLESLLRRFLLLTFKLICKLIIIKIALVSASDLIIQLANVLLGVLMHCKSFQLNFDTCSNQANRSNSFLLLRISECE